MEGIDYERLLPQEPLTDIAGFARQNGRFQKHYLIYRSERRYVPLEERTEDAVSVTCSACGKSFYADKIRAGGCHPAYAPAPFGWFHPMRNEPMISGQETVCPLCGEPAKTVHIGNIRTYGGELVDDVWVTELARIPWRARGTGWRCWIGASGGASASREQHALKSGLSPPGW